MHLTCDYWYLSSHDYEHFHLDWHPATSASPTIGRMAFNIQLGPGQPLIGPAKVDTFEYREAICGQFKFICFYRSYKKYLIWKRTSSSLKSASKIRKIQCRSHRPVWQPEHAVQMLKLAGILSSTGNGICAFVLIILMCHHANSIWWLWWQNCNSWMEGLIL